MRLDDVHARYRRKGDWVLRGITADIAPGDLIVVTGRNGSGKSTLLRVIAGVQPIAPRSLGRGAVSDRPAVVGWAPESFPPEQPWTVRAYLERLFSVRQKTGAREKIAQLAARLYLEEYLGTELRELSKGTVRKVALAQALLAEPELLVLDEPWDGLDAETQAELPALMKEVTAVGGSCVVTDHLGKAVEIPGIRHWHLTAGQLVEGPNGDLA